MNDLNRHKKSDKIKWGLTAVAFLLLVVMLACVCLEVFVPSGKKIKPSEWFQKEETTESMPEESGAETGGLYIPETENGTEISLVSAVIPVSQYEEYGVVSTAESAQTLTATVQPDNNAENTKVKWEARFKNPASSWAVRETVSDYLTLSYGDACDTSKTCVVSCLKPFGEQIIIEVSSLDNPDVTAEVKADYVRKATSFSLSFGSIHCTLDGVTEVPVEVNAIGSPAGGTPNLNVGYSTTYTLADSFTVTYSLSDSGERILYDEMSSKRVYWWDFGTGNVKWSADEWSAGKGAIDRSKFTSYDVANKGLYFGFKYFIDNMDLHYYYCFFGGNDVALCPTDAAVYLYPSEQLDTYNGIVSGGTYNDGSHNHTCSGLNLFRLTVRVQGQYSTVEKSTLFKIKNCTNSTSITGVSVDEQNLYY